MVNEQADEHGGNVWKESARLGLGVDELIDFSASINPLGPSPRALEAIRDNLLWVKHYPDPSSTALRAALARYLEVRPENLMVGNGAAELIGLVGGWVNPGRLVTLLPTFSEYRRAAAGSDFGPVALRAADGFCFRMPEGGWEDFLANRDLVFICNPNNPTGTLVSKEELLDLAEVVRARDSWLVVDQAFLDFIPRPADYSMVEVAVTMDRVLVLGSLTKFFALPGLRLGYLVGMPATLEELRKRAVPWRVNILAQVAGTASLEDEEYIAATRDLIVKEKENLYRDLSVIPGLKPYHPAANFILVNCFQTGLTASHLSQALARRGILIRDCANFQGLDPYFFRVAVRGPADNAALVAGLKETLMS